MKLLFIYLLIEYNHFHNKIDIDKIYDYLICNIQPGENNFYLIKIHILC